jgi:peptide/nickel transport system substrate-binding protein
MKRSLPGFAAAGTLFLAMFVAELAFAQKQGGILKMYDPDSPASMSIHEEATIVSERPMMGVFNNLVIFDQHVKQNSLESIVPDLATSWSWNEDGTELTLPLRQGITWHDGKPFTAKDVQCTWDLLTGKASEKLRVNPRKSWYRNLAAVTTNGDYEVTFHLTRPQPAFLMLLASGYSPIYPCHVPPRDMRQHPIGTGPFKFVAFKPNEYIKVTRNPDYWKKGRPYLDGIEYTIIRNLSTAILAFAAGKFDMTFAYSVTEPLLKDVKSQMPGAICELAPIGVNRSLIANREKPPFDNPELRQAMALSFDRQAFVDIVTEGQGDIGGVMQPPPEGLWGMPPDILKTLPGYDPDVRKNRTDAPPDHGEARLWARETAQGQGVGTRPPVLPRPCRDYDRPVEGGVHRRRARNDRHRQLAAQGHAQGLQHWAQPGGWWTRSRPKPLPELRVRRRTEL